MPAVPPSPAGRRHGPSFGAGRVARVDEAGADLVVDGRLLRATWGGGALAALAHPRTRPRVGDVVRWVRWPDGPVTVEGVPHRPVAAERPGRAVLAAVADLYADVRRVARGCAAGCPHLEDDPGCAVHGALARGELGPERVAGWRRSRRVGRWGRRSGRHE